MSNITLILIFALIAVITIFSCKKPNEPVFNPNTEIKTANETELKIQLFLISMNNQLKDEITFSIDDAIWYAEATLNFTYAIYDSSFIYLSHESSSFSINLNPNNTVNQSDLVAEYQKMVDSLEAHYDDIQGSPKHVLLCDVINLGSSLGTLYLKMISVIGYNYTINQYGSFGQTDYWFAGGELGKCDIYYPSYIGRDATTELEYKLLHPLIASVGNVRIYYSDIVTVYIDPYNYPYQNSPRGFRGYYFYINNSGGIQCLPPDELNFYISTNGIPYIINANDTYNEKEFCGIDVIYDFVPGDRFWLEEHFLDINYGVRNETEIEASEL